MSRAGVDRAQLAEMTDIDAYDLEDSLDAERAFLINELDAIATALTVDVVALVSP